MQVSVGPTEDGVATIVVAGEVDLATAHLIGEGLRELDPAQPLHVRLDLSAVSFCDAAGLSAFLAGDRLLRATGGQLTLIRPSPQVRRLLSITELDQVLTIG